MTRPFWKYHMWSGVAELGNEASTRNANTGLDVNRKATGLLECNDPRVLLLVVKAYIGQRRSLEETLLPNIYLTQINFFQLQPASKLQSTFKCSEMYDQRRQIIQSESQKAGVVESIHWGLLHRLFCCWFKHAIASNKLFARIQLFLFHRSEGEMHVCMVTPIWVLYYQPDRTLVLTILVRICVSHQYKERKGTLRQHAEAKLVHFSSWYSECLLKHILVLAQVRLSIKLLITDRYGTISCGVMSDVVLNESICKWQGVVSIQSDTLLESYQTSEARVG